MTKWKIVALVFIAGITIISCSKTDDMMQEPQPYTLQVPANFPQPVFDTQNPLTKEGIELGRQWVHSKLSQPNTL